jgi:hypothetical protein
MKVICIDDKWGTGVGPEYTKPVFGEEVNVIDVCKAWGSIFVCLQEHPNGFFKWNHFAPLDGPCEVQLSEDREAARLDIAWEKIKKAIETT